MSDNRVELVTEAKNVLKFQRSLITPWAASVLHDLITELEEAIAFEKRVLSQEKVMLRDIQELQAELGQKGRESELC